MGSTLLRWLGSCAALAAVGIWIALYFHVLGATYEVAWMAFESGAIALVVTALVPRLSVFLTVFTAVLAALLFFPGVLP